MEIKPNNIYLGDAYKLIKDIPDKSIDLIYTDIPYLMAGGGGGSSSLSQRIEKQNFELGNKNCREKLIQREKELLEKMRNAKTKDEYEKWHCQHGNVLNKLNLKTADIVDGIDFKILDEFVRVQRYIYIYIYGVVKNKYHN